MGISRIQFAKIAAVSLALVLVGWQITRTPIFREFLVSQSPRLGSVGISMIPGALQDDDTHVRMAAAEALKQIGKDAVPYLITDLKSPDPKVRADAIQALAILGNESRSSAPLLIEQFGESDSATRIRILFALAVFQETNDSIKNLLLQSLSDGDSEVRATTAEAIGALYSDMPDAELIDALVDHLGDPNSNVRDEAQESLERIRARRDLVVAALKKASSDPNSRASKSSAEFLRQLEKNK